MKYPASIIFLAATCGFALLISATSAQSTGAPPGSPPTSQPAQPQTPPPASIDDLLKIDGEKPAAEMPPAEQSPPDAAVDEAKRELDKELSEAEVANAFVQAVEKMGVAATLLDEKFDPGLGTQRVQEDIIAKLSTLLDQAKKNKSSSSSSSSSSRRQQQQKQQDPGQRQDQQNQQNQQNQRNNNPADNRAEIDPPPGQDANANSLLEETRSEWGNLPQRVRDMLLQGRKDNYSTLYKRLTEEYYKRLAEDGSP